MSAPVGPVPNASEAIKPPPVALSLTIKDKAALYAAYIPYIRQAGLFIPTNKLYQFGDEISLIIRLMEETENFSVLCKVVWITPQGAQGNRVAGIGVQFQGEEGVKVRNKIETYLAGALKSERPTHTM